MSTSAQATKPLPNVDELLCFAVYGAGLAFNRVYRRLLDDLDLTYPQYLALVVLWERDGVTTGYLGERLSLDTNTLTPMLKRMEAMRLLTRQRDSADERRVIVSLTERGRSMRREAGDVMRCIAEAAGLPHERLAGLTAEIRDLRARLERYARTEASG